MIRLEDAPAVGRPGRDLAGLDGPYWDGLAQGELRLQCCAECRSWIWSPQPRCGTCGAWDPPWQATPMCGEVYSWTRSHHAFAPEVAAFVPYVTLLVALPEAGGRRLMGLLVGPEEGLRIGAPVEGVIQAASPLTRDTPLLRWKLSTREVTA